MIIRRKHLSVKTGNLRVYEYDVMPHNEARMLKALQKGPLKFDLLTSTYSGQGQVWRIRAARNLVNRGLADMRGLWLVLAERAAA